MAERKQSSRPKRVLFFSLNSPGHLNSSLGIADVLKERGFETIFITLGPMMWRDVQDHSHQTVTIVDDEPFVDNDGKEYAGAAKWPVIMEKCRIVDIMDIAINEMVRELKCYNKRYHKEIERLNPDVVVVDKYFIPPCIVTGRRPWLRVFSANPLMLSITDRCPPALAGFSIPTKDTPADKWMEHQRQWNKFREQIRTKTKPFRDDWEAWLQSEGCPPLPKDKFTYDSPHLNIYMFPACVDYDDFRPYPPRWVRCESLMRKDSSPADDENSVAMSEVINKSKQIGKKVIYFSMGSLASGNIKMVEKLVAALSKSPHQFIVSKGSCGDRYQLANNMWGRNFLLQTRALRQVDMALTHGGNNSFVECFYYGCPMVVLPAFGDQLDNAQRAVDKGYGKQLSPYSFDENELLAAIDEVLNDHGLLARMKKVSKEMQSKSGASKAADMVGMLATEGSLEDATIDKFKAM